MRRRPQNTAATWVMAGILGVALTVFIVVIATRDPSSADVTGAARATADELEKTPVRGLGIDVFDVRQAMKEANPGSGRLNTSVADKLQVESAGEDSDGDGLYEITTSKGRHPVCLTVSTDDDSFGDGSHKDDDDPFGDGDLFDDDPFGDGGSSGDGDLFDDHNGAKYPTVDVTDGHCRS